MKTTNQTIELSKGQEKAIALMQYNNEDYFILDGEIYTGKKEDAKKSYKAEIKTLEKTTPKPTFNEWVADNCEKVEEIDGDDERDNYIVLIDDEANEKAADYIKDSLWAFTPSFLSSETGIYEEVFKAIQDNDKCESNNDAIKSCIDDLDSFIKAAILEDGRGHFINSYDGNENEETVNGTIYYIYRMN